MAEPRVPGGRGEVLDLPCGEQISVYDLDMGLREFECDCGKTHAVVVDVHPLSRFVPESLADVLRGAIETSSGVTFSMTHLMGVVLEEFPENVVAADVSDDGEVGYAMVWVTDFDSRRLHAVVVELIVELMEHAVSHAEDESAVSNFEAQMHEFDVDAFVEAYRRDREFASEHDSPA
ncbi:MAG: DUF5815 family protein [Halobacteriales archaeon]|nr:DUF5815 family protein [Halobacteriales archaeon]